jgi:cytidylate kinase
MDDGSIDLTARASAPSETQGALESSRPAFELTTSPRFPAWLAAQRANRMRRIRCRSGTVARLQDAAGEVQEVVRCAKAAFAGSDQEVS